MRTQMSDLTRQGQGGRPGTAQATTPATPEQWMTQTFAAVENIDSTSSATHSPATCRVATLSRFQALIATTERTNSA